MKKIFYFILLSLFFFSCQKTFDCISKTGEIVTYEYSVADFDTLIVNNDFDIHLIQDTVNKVFVSAYKKFADDFTYTVQNNSLIIGNDNKCKFTKPKKNDVRLDLHVKKISLARINYPSKLVSDNTLINDNEIGIIVGTKFFEADLNIDSRVFYFWNSHLGGGKMYLHGNSEFLKLNNVSLFAIDASDLYSDNDFIENASKGDIYLNAEKFLSCKITGSGNVYYKGNPAAINVEDSLSSGKLIKNY